MPALGASLPITIIFIAILSIVLTAADRLGLSAARTSGWIAVLYGLPALPSLALAIRYRQPTLLTGNVFAIIFVVSLGDQIPFSELAGASFLAGAIVMVAALFNLRVASRGRSPAPIVHGLVAGAVMPFVFPARRSC